MPDPEKSARVREIATWSWALVSEYLTTLVGLFGVNVALQAIGAESNIAILSSEVVPIIRAIRIGKQWQEDVNSDEAEGLTLPRTIGLLAAVATYAVAQPIRVTFH